MKQLVVTIIFSIIILISSVLFAQEKGKNKQTSITETTDIHYTAKYCEECHEKRPERGGDKLLKFGGDFRQLCRCHDYSSAASLHPVDIEPSVETKAKIPPDFPLIKGKVSCVTCHDIYMQCQESKVKKKFLINRNFLRGGPFRRRTDFCFRCHDEKSYMMYDPHNQLNDNGDIIAEKCLYCHVQKPDEKSATFKDVKLIGNLGMICQRCHGERKKHPANVNHLLNPSAKTLATMKETEDQFKIILPLAYDGKITCVTCHNPHERGVIPSQRSGAKGASKKYRHRLPGRICMACHPSKI